MAACREPWRGSREFHADEWQHKGCGGQPREFEPGKFDCTGCKSAWYCGEFFEYLAGIVFVKRV
jgi:hypothetical protein